MTHDELMVEMNKPIILSAATHADIANYEPLCKRMSALRAVVELHKSDKWNLCDTCNTGDYVVWYPCPTIQAIEKELE